MTVIKDAKINDDNAAVAGILLHLHKQEERHNLLQWFFGLIVLAFIMSLFLAVVIH